MNLNDKQKEAVKHRDGPLLIIAGAGTGKTAVITQKVLDLIKSVDAKPTEILALTFTEKAASEMIERIDIEMPIGYEEVTVSTFHSFCDSVLRKDSVYLGIDSNYSLMTEAQAYVFFRKYLYDFPLDTLRPLGNPAANITQILRHFSRLQDEEVFPEEYNNFVKKLSKNNKIEEEQKKEFEELAATYEMYTNKKIEESKMDFGDLILQTIKLFRDKPNILDKYHQRYKYILVDEFQDTNYTQNVLVNLLALNGDPQNVDSKIKCKANITVVGDDDQAIYKFRGAAISNILHFKENFPTAKKIVLIENYRSRQQILDHTYSLIQHNNPERLEVTEEVNKKLISKVVDEEKGRDYVNIISADTGMEEAENISKEILKLTGNIEKLKKENSIVHKKYDSKGQGMFMDIDNWINKKYEYSDIAILVRAHAHADEIVKTLRKNGIPYKFSGAKGLYTRPEVQDLISYLKIIANYADDISMFNLLSMDIWGLSTRELIEIFKTARQKKISVFEFFEEIWNIKVGEDKISDKNFVPPNNLGQKILSEKSQNKIWKILEIINDSFTQVKDNINITQIIFDFFKKSGFMDSLLEKDDSETFFKVQNIGKYLELVQSFEKDNLNITIFEYLNYLDYSIDIGETPKVDMDAFEDYNAVNISTVHGAKGLEYPVVFVVNLVEERFPSRNRGESLPIPEELIKDIVSDDGENAENSREERRLFYVACTRAKELLYLTLAKFYGDAKRKKKQSRFLDEIMDKKMQEILDAKGNSGKKDINIEMLNYLDKSSGENIEELDVSEISDILPSTISYSHINLYKSCPKKYKYRYILNVPGLPSSTLSFGSSIHNTLKDFYDRVKLSQGSIAGFSDLPTKKDLIDTYEMKWVSSGYENKKHEKLRKTYGKKIIGEYYEKYFDPKTQIIGVETMFRYHLDTFILKGFIDRIDLLKIVGSEQHVEIIDYKTGSVKKGSDKEVNLQLALYALVAKEVLGYKVDKASLLFIEHDVKISLEIDDNLIKTIKSEIIDVVNQIRKREFTAEPGFLCKYCDYKDICNDSLQFN